MHNPEWGKMMDPEAGLPFKLDRWVDLAPFEKLLGMRILHAQDGEAVLTMPFTVKLAQGMGLMHGGAITALADTSSAMAVKTLLPEGTHFATAGLETRFLAPVRKGTITARAKASAIDGKDSSFGANVEVQDQDGILAAVFVSTFKVSRRLRSE